MPKQRITKEMILDVAFKLTREKGYEQVVVKNIADEMGCSVQPVYSYFNNMEGVKEHAIFIYARINKFVIKLHSRSDNRRRAAQIFLMRKARLF